jgi:phenylpropionate dioxygenase-like ring-hydroxylating dioxygenase large terminal subunit
LPWTIAARTASLARGTLVGDAIQCRYHGLRFGTTGECVHMRNGEKAPARARLRTYPIVDRFELLWIWMGEPELADPETIPDFAYLTDEKFGWFNGTLHAKANISFLSTTFWI